MPITFPHLVKVETVGDKCIGENMQEAKRMKVTIVTQPYGMTIQSTQVFESNGVNVGEKNWTIGEE
jgi:hypothetical protein